MKNMSSEEALLSVSVVQEFRAHGLQLNGVDRGVYTYQIEYYPFDFYFKYVVEFQNLLSANLNGMCSGRPHVELKFFGPPEIWYPTDTNNSGVRYNYGANAIPDSTIYNVRRDWNPNQYSPDCSRYQTPYICNINMSHLPRNAQERSQNNYFPARSLHYPRNKGRKNVPEPRISNLETRSHSSNARQKTNIVSAAGRSKNVKCQNGTKDNSSELSNMIDTNNSAQWKEKCPVTEYEENLSPGSNVNENLERKPTGLNLDLKRTVRIINVKEDPKEDTKSLVIKLILKSRRLLLKNQDILHCRRVGRRNNSLPRPIVVTFSSNHICNKILQRFSYDDLQIFREANPNEIETESQVKFKAAENRNVLENNSKRNLSENSVTSKKLHKTSKHTVIKCTFSSVKDDSIISVNTAEYISQKQKVSKDKTLQLDSNAESSREYLEYESECLVKIGESQNLERDDSEVKNVDAKYGRNLSCEMDLKKDDKVELDNQTENSSRDSEKQLQRNKKLERIDSLVENKIFKDIEKFGQEIHVTDDKAQSDSTTKCCSKDLENEFTYSLNTSQNTSLEDTENFLSGIESENNSKIHRISKDRKCEDNLSSQIEEYEDKILQPANSKVKYSTNLSPKLADTKFQHDETNIQYEDNLLSEIEETESSNFQSGHTNIKYAENLAPDFKECDNCKLQGENRDSKYEDSLPFVNYTDEDSELAVENTESIYENTFFKKSVRILRVKEVPEEDLKSLVINLISKFRNVVITSEDILQCKRVGRQTNPLPRAIVVTFRSRKLCKKVLNSHMCDDLPIVQELCPEMNSLRLQAERVFGRENVHLVTNGVFVKLSDGLTMKFKSKTELDEYLMESFREAATFVNIHPEELNRIEGDYVP